MSADLGRVILRDVQDSDLDALFEQQNDQGAHWMDAFIAGREPGDRGAFDLHWSRIQTDPSITIQTMLAGGEVAGNVIPIDLEGRREAGHWIGRALENSLTVSDAGAHQGLPFRAEG